MVIFSSKITVFNNISAHLFHYLSYDYGHHSFETTGVKQMTDYNEMFHKPPLQTNMGGLTPKYLQHSIAEHSVNVCVSV